MDFTQTRCPVCFKHFCCVSHRTTHQVKCLSEKFARRHTHHLVNVFQKNAEALLFKKQNRQKILENNKEYEAEKVSAIHQQRPKSKRSHSEINKVCAVQSSSSVLTVLTQTRKILAPVHRTKLNRPLRDVDDNKETIEKEVSEMSKGSGYINTVVKTSTPIYSSLDDKNPSEVMWNTSSESTISNYHTPSGPSPNLNNEHKLMIKSNKQKIMITPLRGIICKTSKYDFESDLSGPNSATNTSKGHKVTFSFSSSQISSTSTLESVQEVDACEENDYDPVENLESPRKIRKISTLFEDSSNSNTDTGFFSCMSSIFCSAIHTIPSLASWRRTEAGSVVIRSKHSSSRKARGAYCQDINTSFQRQLRYIGDLRNNPIRSRKPISEN